MSDDLKKAIGGGYASLPKDINAKRTSPTIVRQELLSLFRILNRQCFDGRLADLAVHMQHKAEKGVNEPMVFWVNTKGGGSRPTISISKEKLMTLEAVEMFPELCEMSALYWLHEEGKDPSKEHPEYQDKLKYVQEHAEPKFIGVASQEPILS